MEGKDRAGGWLLATTSEQYEQRVDKLGVGGVYDGEHVIFGDDDELLEGGDEEEGGGVGDCDWDGGGGGAWKKVLVIRV